MNPTVSIRMARQRAMARWCSAAVLAAAFSAVALTACGPHDDARPTAGAATSSTQTAAAAPAAATATIAATPADPARAGTPVPATAPAPAAVVAPSTMTAARPAMSPPPVAVAQAPIADDRVEPRPAPAPGNARVAPKPAAPSGRLGSVESIEPIRERPQGTGAGAVIGGVAGAVIGNQFGHGLGRAALTGLGAAGGAVAGNNVERNVRKRIVGYRVHVRLDDGRTRTFERDQVGNLRVGDRVRVDRNGFRRA